MGLPNPVTGTGCLFLSHTNRDQAQLRWGDDPQSLVHDMTLT